MTFKVGLIGCGQISDIYLQNCARFDEIDVVACASLSASSSAAKAAKYGIPRSCQPDDIFADPQIDAVLNLTVPSAHAEISLSALAAGKHVYSEKPFVSDLSDGRRILERADRTGLTVGNAPDTFLGGRWQTCRKLLDAGVIGQPIGVSARVGTHGPEWHHTNPDFFYQPGGGPLLDLGPYYLTAMVFLLGPIARVAGMSRRTSDRRQVETGPRSGASIAVDVETHVESLLEFRSGVVGSMTTSFDVWDSQTPRFEIVGTTGTLCIPDPDPAGGANVFHGPVLYRTRDTSQMASPANATADWLLAENTHGYNENMRGLGLLDMVHAVHEGRKPRASAEMGYHVCDVMDGILTAPKLGRYVDIASTCDRPAPLPELNGPTGQHTNG